MEEKNPITKNDEIDRKYKEIQEKRTNKKRLSYEDKIFLKQMELSNLKIALSEKQRKDKIKWIKNINKIVSNELEKIYDREHENLDLKIATTIIFAITNYEKILKDLKIDDFVIRNKKGEVVRVKKEG